MYVFISKAAAAMQPPVEDLSSPGPSEKFCGRSLVSKDPSGTSGNELSSSTTITDSMGFMSPNQLDPTDLDHGSVGLASNSVHILVTSAQPFPHDPSSASVRKNAPKLSGRRGRKS